MDTKKKKKKNQESSIGFSLKKNPRTPKTKTKTWVFIVLGKNLIDMFLLTTYFPIITKK